MAKCKTSSYVLTLKLDTNHRDVVILEKRMEICRKLYNAILGLGLKKLKALSELKIYRSLRKELAKINKEYHNCTDGKKLKSIEKNRKSKYKELSELFKIHGLNEYSLINLMTPMYKPFHKNIDNKTAQALASRAWKALEKRIYGDAERVNFIRYGEMHSIEGKWNASGITYRDGFMKWNKLKIPIIIKNGDLYAQKAIQDRVKYCRIVRKIMKGKIKYDIQFVMEGLPPTKMNKQTGEVKRQVGIGDVGLDIGIRTIAIASKTDVKLLELCPKIDNIEHKKWILQRKLDRQRRANNPNNYKEDGTIKRGVKLIWIKSNRYIQTQYELKEVQRKQADIRKQSHEDLANYIISLGDTIKVESMSFKGLQKRSKKTEKNDKGKFKRKKRFGKSIGNKAPAMLLEIIDRKLDYENLELLKINIQKVKASQYNHVTDECNKKELKDRWNKDIEIQRDMYSAFLIMNVNNDLESINRDQCIERYDKFKELHDLEVCRLRELKRKGYKLISSMGI